jgi:hypothetical protein
MSTDTLSEKTRRELAAVSRLCGKLMQHCAVTGDDITAELAQQINARVFGVCQELRAAGQELPAVSMQAAGLEVPLHLLDTTANRRYLAALVEAHRAALEVDFERGYGEDGPAQDLEDLVAEVKMEIFGPGGGKE